MGLSFMEIALIALVALVVIGPKKLPEVAKSLGKGYAEFRRAFGEFKQTMDVTNLDKPTQSKSQTYKSKWEEQNTDAEPEQKPEQPITADSAADKDSAKLADKEPADKEPERAKRTDLIKGDGE